MNFWVYWRLKCGGVHTSHPIDSWWLNIIRAVLISGCVRNMWWCLINVTPMELWNDSRRWISTCIYYSSFGMRLRWVFAYVTNGQLKPKLLVKVVESLVLNHVLMCLYLVFSKVGLIASIFSKVCSILWAKLSIYVFPK